MPVTSLLAAALLAAHEPTIPEEALALQALYEAAGGAQWGLANAGWLTGDPCGMAPYFCGQNCKGWQGVHCWGPGGHVRKLQQRSFHGHGTLPTELGLLRGLSALELPGAGLSGTLPSELAQVPFRRTATDGAALVLSGHRLSGSIPAELPIALPEDLPRCRLPATLGCSAAHLVGAPRRRVPRRTVCHRMR